MNLNINIVDACNLQCPSCPRGRGQLPSTTRQMDTTLLRQILEKAKTECSIHETELYDTCEPTMHRDLPAMIRLAREYGPVALSSNASIPNTDWKAILEAGPYLLVLALAGFTAATHARSHPGSKLEVVKRAMGDIQKILQANPKLSTEIRVLYHRYKYNLDEEEDAKKMVLSYGFNFAPLWAAVLYPRGMENICDCVLSPEQARAIGALYPIKRCLVLERNININVVGDVIQCAGFSHVKANYLTTPLEDIQEKRRADPLCIECRQTGMGHYVCRNPVLDYYNAKQVGDRLSYRWQRMKHWMFHFKESLSR
jgi:MoaA/NifB/PqqE/SkfB family radical SAM enzyme